MNMWKVRPNCKNVTLKLGSVVTMINGLNERNYGIVVDLSGRNGKYKDEPIGVFWTHCCGELEGSGITYYPNNYVSLSNDELIISNNIE